MMRYTVGMKKLSIGFALAVMTTVCSLPSGIMPASANPDALLGPVAMATTPAESNAANSAGDIPDTQVFVTYRGDGYSVLVPEGWSRTQRRSTVTFNSNFTSEMIDVFPAKTPFDASKMFGAAGALTVSRGTLGNSPATIVRFTTQSKPNPVTGKRVRLDQTAYVGDRRGRRVVLALSAPAGADNADQWKKIAASFRWK